MRERSATGFSNEDKLESQVVQLWALDLSRMTGASGLPHEMPVETRRRIRGKISAVHQDLDSQSASALGDIRKPVKRCAWLTFSNKI